MKPRHPQDRDHPPAEEESLPSTIDLPGARPSAARMIELDPFQALNQEILGLLQRNMSERRFEPGELLMKQGEPGDSLMVLSGGEAEVSVEEAGNRHVLKRARAGEILGEMALLTEEPRMASVVAITPVRARVLSAERFDKLAERHPRISTFLTLLLASRLGTGPHDAMTGKPFHGYRIKRCVGHGGMSVVYEAEDIESRRHVALKMMSHRLIYDLTAMEHFRHEADIVESFDHPNIAKIYGRFEAFRTSFIVMEFCGGTSISTVMAKARPLPEPVVRKILGQIASAVAYAHEAGIVHRDIKPSNIMVTPEGMVKLIDFGLAGQLDKESLAPALYGTPHFMAPEQMSGGPVGKKIDLFAMGHVAFQMLSGRRLFNGKDFAAIKAEVIRCRIPDLATTFPDVSPELRGVLHGLLIKDPDERRLDFDLVRSWAAPVDDERFTVQR